MQALVMKMQTCDTKYHIHSRVIKHANIVTPTVLDAYCVFIPNIKELKICKSGDHNTFYKIMTI